jgi:4-amino-4-deoxy-L-arabinose transferase-like glycosyltransferase
MRNALHSRGLQVAILALVLAFGLLGSRGIWDPDEGRYSNVALNMLDSGDWLNPRRNDEVGHWTKPPLTYWAIAASVAVFGANPWAARLPAALSYLLCVWLAWRIARRLTPGAQAQAAVVYATMLFTVGASQLITTDYLLAACTTLAMCGFVEARFGVASGAEAGAHGHPARWIALMWLGFALAFLCKGPVALLPLLVVVVFDALMPRRHEHRLFDASGMILFALLALPWYIAVIHGNPGLFEYFIGDEVVNRVTTNEFGRHGEWYGWIEIYVPTLLLGTVPWTSALLRWARALPASLRRWWGGTRCAARWTATRAVAAAAAAGVLLRQVAHAAVPAAAVRAAGDRRRATAAGRGTPHAAVALAAGLGRLAAAAETRRRALADPQERRALGDGDPRAGRSARA